MTTSFVDIPCLVELGSFQKPLGERDPFIWCNVCSFGNVVSHLDGICRVLFVVVYAALDQTFYGTTERTVYIWIEK